MRKSPALKARIESSRNEIDGQIVFTPEIERINNVMLKLARGHAAFELSQPCRNKPDHFWCGPLSLLTEEERENFNAVHFQEIFGEVGSRNLQRLLVTQFTLRTESGEQNVGMLINDWIDVQDNLYRFLAVDDAGGLVIRIVVAEYLACEVAWKIKE